MKSTKKQTKKSVSYGEEETLQVSAQEYTPVTSKMRTSQS